MTAREAQTGGGPAVRFRPRRLGMADGGILVLTGDGTIEHRDAAGSTVGRWAADDPAWPGHAIRFGLQPSAATVPPRGRYVPGSKPPA